MKCGNLDDMWVIIGRYLDEMRMISRRYVDGMWVILYLTTAYAERHDLTLIKLYYRERTRKIQI